MTPRVHQYVQEAAAEHGTYPQAILGRCRLRTVYRARQQVMRRLRADGFSYTQIGRWIGRDHTTVMYGVRGS
jgi:chromosomal replication initiation ATPase DnaA